MAENAVAITFDIESQAYQAFYDLKTHALEGGYVVSEAGLVKIENGQTKLLDRFVAGTDTYDDTIQGGLVGSIIGILGGPLGVLFGGSVGALSGSIMDADDEDRNISLVDVTARKLYEGEIAIVALVQESDETLLEADMDKFETTIIRWDAATVEEEVEELRNVESDMAKKALAALRKEKSDERKARIEDYKSEIRGHFEAIKAKFQD